MGFFEGVLRLEVVVVKALDSIEGMTLWPLLAWRSTASPSSCSGVPGGLGVIYIHTYIHGGSFAAA